LRTALGIIRSVIFLKVSGPSKKDKATGRIPQMHVDIDNLTDKEFDLNLTG